MIPRLKTALGASNSEKQSKIMLMKSNIKNCLKDKNASYGLVKEGMTKQLMKDYRL